MSNFTKQRIGWIDEYGNERYYPLYDDYEDISEDYSEEEEPNPRHHPNDKQNISKSDWNRYQQRKYYKNLRENLNNSSNPEYSRPQHLSNDIQFAPIHQHNHNSSQFPNDKITHFQNNLKNNSRKVVAGAGDLLAKVQQVQNTSMQNSGRSYRNPLTSILATGMNIDTQGKWMYIGDSVMYVHGNSLYNNIELPNSRILDIGTKYSTNNSEIVTLNNNGMYTITNLNTGKIQTLNGMYFQPPKPSSISNIHIDEYEEMKYALLTNPALSDAMYVLMDSEKGYVDGKNDPGKKTKYGIAETGEWPNFAKRFNIDPNPNNIKFIEREQAELYYFETRFKRFRLDKIKDRRLFISIFDQSALFPNLINKYIKKALNRQGYNITLNNNNLTDQEVNLINSADQTKLLNDFLDVCLEHYEDIKKTNLKNYNDHIDGWRNRINKLINLTP